VASSEGIQSPVSELDTEVMLAWIWGPRGGVDRRGVDRRGVDGLFEEVAKARGEQAGRGLWLLNTGANSEGATLTCIHIGTARTTFACSNRRGRGRSQEVAGGRGGVRKQGGRPAGEGGGGECRESVSLM
jgi:hypothetical protein